MLSLLIFRSSTVRVAHTRKAARRARRPPQPPAARSWSARGGLRSPFAMSLGRTNEIHAIDYSNPGRPCRCPEPAADPREMTCVYCGHQVAGVAIPNTHIPRSLGDHSTAAAKRVRR